MYHELYIQATVTITGTTLNKLFVDGVIILKQKNNFLTYEKILSAVESNYFLTGTIDNKYYGCLGVFAP